MCLRGSERTPMRAIPSGSAWRTGNALHCEQSLKGLDSQHYEPTYYILSLQNTRRTGSTPQKSQPGAAYGGLGRCADQLRHASAACQHLKGTTSNNSSNRRRRRRRSIMPCTDVCLVRACSTELQTASLVPQAAQHTRRLCGVKECLPNTSQWRNCLTPHNGCILHVVCSRANSRY